MHAECQTASVHTASGQTCSKPPTPHTHKAYMHAQASVCSNACVHKPATHAECQTASVHTASGQTCSKPPTPPHAQSLHARASIRLLKCMRAQTSNTHRVPNSQRALRKWTDMQQTTQAPTRTKPTCTRMHPSAQMHACTHQQHTRSAKQPACTLQVDRHAANHPRPHTHKACMHAQASVCSNACVHAPATHAECQTASVHTASGQTCSKPPTLPHAQSLHARASIRLLKRMSACTSNARGAQDSHRAHRK
jgi:phosphotransferase system HPr-like phosphotransfer protein